MVAYSIFLSLVENMTISIENVKISSFQRFDGNVEIW